MARIISPSLLKNVDVNKKVPPEFDLGMDDFVDDDAFEPPRSKRRLKGKENAQKPLQLKKSKRYEGAFNTSDQEFCELGI